MDDPNHLTVIDVIKPGDMLFLIKKILLLFLFGKLALIQLSLITYTFFSDTNKSFEKILIFGSKFDHYQ